MCVHTCSLFCDETESLQPERDRERKRERKRERERVCVCEREYVCACTYVASFVMHIGPKGGHLREREREREKENECVSAYAALGCRIVGRHSRISL